METKPDYSEFLNKFSQKHYLALQTPFTGEPKITTYIGEIRATKDIMGFLFAHVRNQGCILMESISKNGLGVFNSTQEEIFDRLAKKVKFKVEALEEKVFQKILAASIKIKTELTLSRQERIVYMENTRIEIQQELKTYLEWCGRWDNTINEDVKTVFDYLSMVLPNPRRNNEEKTNLRHNYIGAIMFCRYFFSEGKAAELKKEPEKTEFQKMLELAKAENFSDILQDFSFAAKKTDRIASRRFCKACEGRYENLAEFLNQSEDRVLRASIGVGNKGLNLFKEFIKAKGYRFAEWNGKEYE